MAGPKNKLGALGAIGKRLLETPEEARLRELLSHSGDKALPLKLPRANLSDEFINAQADRVARQMLGEHVTSGKVGDTKNLAGRSMKESQRVKNLNYKLTPTGTVAKETPYVPRKGDVKVAFPGDQTVSDKILDEVEGFPIDSPQQGGAYYGLGQKHLKDPEFWKSTETPAKNVQAKVDRVAELYDPERVIGSHLAMGPMSNNFAMHLADANLRAIDWSKAQPSKINQFDRLIAKGYFDPVAKKKVTFPDWPGLADREAALAAMKENTALRKWVNNRFKTPAVTEPLGLPNGLDIQYAITEPRIRDMEINMTGLMTGELKPNALVEAAGAPHNTYSHRILGEAGGPQEVLTPFVLDFPDAAKHIASTKRPSDFTGTIQKVFPHQVVDDQYINQYNQYRERIKKLTGQKKGGAISISEADKRLAKAIENRMAKGGEVDLEAADARLSAAIEARMGMAGGGKVKGAAKAFKKLFADDVVNGMRIRQDIPNQSSIGASLTDYSTHGLQEVPMSAFETVGKPRYRSVQEEKRTKELARQIQENKELNPLIVVKDAEGHYILEGGHRFDALRELDINSFPALMVHDLESLGTVAKADGGKIVKGAGKVMKKLFADDEPYSEISGMVSKMGEEGRLPIIPVPNRWFMQPDKFPNQQKLIERVLQQTGKSREDFMSGAFIDPRTGEILDSRIMDDLGVVIDPKTNRPMMSAKGESGLEQMNPKTGSYTKSNLVRKGLFKPEGGDPLLNDLNFLATIEKGDVGHKYGLATEYASPTELFNTGTGANPTLRPRSRGDLFGVGDVIGRVRVGRSEPHDVYEKLFVAPKGSDVQGKKLSKAKGGLAHMGKGGKMAALGKLGKRLLADPDAVTPTARGGTRKFGNDANGLNIIKETGGNWSPSGDLVYQSQLDRELNNLKKGRFDTPINVIRHNMEQDALAGNTARKAQMEQALAQAQKTEAANKWVDSNLRNYVTKQMATEDDPVRKLAEEGIKAFPVNIDEFGDAELRTYGSAKAKQNRKVTGYVPEGVAKSPLAKHYETMTDEALNITPAERYQSVQALPPMQRPTGTMDAPWVNKLDPETPIFSLNKDADFNKFGFDHIMDVLREDLAAGRIRPEQLNKISMEQAVRRTHEYDEALKAKMLNARIAEQANANVFKEYPEGYKWVQLDKPGQFSLESDIMGHSVRGYEPPQGHPDWADISGNSGYEDYGHGGYEAIKSGRAKIYSLRDPKGMSHATIEIAENPQAYPVSEAEFAKLPSKTKAEYSQYVREWRQRNPDVEELTDEHTAQALREAGVKPKPPRITQIKGKQNAAPNEAYQPYVQDFVKSGDWSEVGDISNTGLRDVKFMTNPDVYQKYLERGLKVPKYATEKELDELHNEYLRLAEPRNYKPPAEGMAEGGGAFKKLQFMGGGGITTSGGSFSSEELGVSPSDIDASKYAKRIGKNAADLLGEGKESLAETYDRVKDSPRARAQLAKILALGTAGGGPDIAHLGVNFILDPLKSVTIDKVLTKPKYRSVLAPKPKKGEKEEREPMFGSIAGALTTDDGYPIGSSEHLIKRAQQAGLMYGKDYPLLNEDGSYAIDPETNEPYQVRSGRFNALTEIGGSILGGLGLSKLGKVAKKGYVKNIEPRVDPAGALTRAINLDYPDADFNQNYLRAR
jgi:hypothetical protein